MIQNLWDFYGIYLLKMVIYPTKMVILWDFIGFCGDFMGFQWNPLVICYIAMEATTHRNRWFTWVYLLIAW
jgi:uncharacterized membrane protein